MSREVSSFCKLQYEELMNYTLKLTDWSLQKVETSLLMK